MTATGIVAAMRFEARCAGAGHFPPGTIVTLPDRTQVVCSGMGADSAALAAQRLIAAGAQGLVSWGVAGGLDPALAAGSLVLATEVGRLDTAGRLEALYPTSEPWRRRLVAALTTRPAQRTPIVEGRLVSSREPVGRRAVKSRLFASTGALAVDLESAAVAQAAAAAGVPWLCIRSVLDTAAEALPAFLLGPAPMAGSPTAAAWCLRILGAPGQWPATLRLAAGYRQARHALHSARAALTAATEEPAA